MTWFWLFVANVVLVTSSQLVEVRLEFCCSRKLAEVTGQAAIRVLVVVPKIRRIGAGGSAALKAVNCISHAPEERLAVALNGPRVVAI